MGSPTIGEEQNRFEGHQGRCPQIKIKSDFKGREGRPQQDRHRIYQSQEKLMSIFHEYFITLDHHHSVVPLTIYYALWRASNQHYNL